MRGAVYTMAGLFLLAGCGGGGGASTTSVPPSITGASSSSVVTLSLPADPNGAMIAGISDAPIVGNLSTAITDVSLTASISSGAGTTSGVVAPPAKAQSVNVRGFAWPDGPSNTDLLRPVLASLRRVGTRAAQVRTAQSLPSTVGSQANFWIQNFQPGIAGVTFQQVPETLVAQTPHANVWVQTSLTSLLGNQNAINTIAGNIENAIGSDSAHFGSATWTSGAPSLATSYATCDTSGNRDGGSSPMWIVPSDAHVNFVYVAPSEISVGGYMDGDSLIPENVIRCTQAQNGTYHSNQAPTIVLAYYGDTHSLNYVLQEDSIVHPAHEYQHLINIVHHAILQSNPQYEDALLNEGLSMLAQDLAIDAATGGSEKLDGENLLRSSQYLAAPQNYSVAGFAGVQSAGGTPLFNCGTCYAPAWLLERYLYDHFGGDAYLQAMEAGAQISWPELQSVTGTAAQSVLQNFAIALAASNTKAATSPQYSFSTVNLRATYTDQLGNQYTLDGPATVGTLSASTALTYNVLLGAYAYFAVPGTSASGIASLSASTPSFDLGGYVADY